eukprot:SAG25_NODE_86_length_16515_cov_5.529996_13_plen_68_part_00
MHVPIRSVSLGECWESPLVDSYRYMGGTLTCEALAPLRTCISKQMCHWFQNPDVGGSGVGPRYAISS